MTTVYRPIDVLEKQVAMIDWWQRSPYRYGFDEAFQPLLDRYRILDAKGKERGQPKLSIFMADRLNKSETIYVRSNIVSRLWNFTDVYEAHEHETMQRDDVPMPNGFVYLEQAVYIMDASGKMCSVKGIMWDVEPAGVIIVMLSDARDPLDEINHELVRDHPEAFTAAGCDMPPLHIESYTWGRRINRLTADDFEIGPIVDRFDSPERHADYEKYVSDNVRYQNRFNQFLVSLWEFMQEQIPLRITADRPMRKRLQRAHSPVTDVTVVQLRPYDQSSYHDPDHESQYVPWTHRWKVREHKRRWIDKHGNYRETTVSAHIKGPEHLPLIEKDKIYHVKK